MNGIGKDLLLTLVLGVLVPAVSIQAGSSFLHTGEPLAYPTESTQALSSDQLTVLFREEDGLVREMDMDAYLQGAVLAEMPVWFEEEALKAQSVAARTYALKAKQTGGKHGDGSVCGYFACCQAYITLEQFLNSGGTDADAEKVRSAVNSTAGQVLTYEGSLIEATYFSCSGGRTEDAAAVWGSDFSYLQAVDSPGEEKAAVYLDVISFDPMNFCEKLGISWSPDSRITIGEITYTNGGGVDTMEICGEIFRGTKLRSLLGLRSTMMDIAIHQDAVIITTHGFGHRVGMSQYGADAMAAAGSTYQEILSHYYPGTSIEFRDE